MTEQTVLPIGESKFCESIGTLPLRSPLVSVIVTAYNCEDFLRDTLQSALQQSYENLECLVVEDGATDRTLLVAEKFLAEARDPRFRLLRNTSNRGQLSAQIHGLRESKGEFVVFLDADDLLAPDAIAVHLRAHLHAWPIAAMSCLDSFTINENDTLLAGHHRETQMDRWRWFLPRPIERQLNDGYGTLDYAVIPPSMANTVIPRDQYFWTTQSFFLFRRDFLKLVMPDDTDSFRICADYYVVRMCHAFCSSLFVQHAGGAYRIHANNGFSQPALISADQLSGDLRRFDWQRSEAEKLAGQVLAERYAQFAAAFGDFHVARAMLSLGRRARPRAYRLLRTGQPALKALGLLLLARFSLAVARVRTTLCTLNRVFWHAR